MNEKWLIYVEDIYENLNSITEIIEMWQLKACLNFKTKYDLGYQPIHQINSQSTHLKASTAVQFINATKYINPAVNLLFVKPEQFISVYPVSGIRWSTP